MLLLYRHRQARSARRLSTPAEVSRKLPGPTHAPHPACCCNKLQVEYEGNSCRRFSSAHQRGHTHRSLPLLLHTRKKTRHHLSGFARQRKQPEHGTTARKAGEGRRRPIFLLRACQVNPRLAELRSFKGTPRIWKAWESLSRENRAAAAKARRSGRGGAPWCVALTVEEGSSGGPTASGGAKAEGVRPSIHSSSWVARRACLRRPLRRRTSTSSSVRDSIET